MNDSATFSFDAEDLTEDAIGEFYELQEKLELDGWRVDVFIDDESLERDDGVIDCMYLQAMRELPSLTSVKDALGRSRVLAGHLRYRQADYVIVGGELMQAPESDGE
jgi:hypothetical protein